jgi:hypothetical protein
VTKVPPAPPENQDPQGAGPNSAPSEGRGRLTPFVWVAVIVGLGGVWWWFGRAEPAAPVPESGGPSVMLNAGASPGRAATLPASGDWALGLKQREMTEVAKRRTQATRQLSQRQGLGAPGERRPDWNAARSRAAIPFKAAADAGARAR